MTFKNYHILTIILAVATFPTFSQGKFQDKWLNDPGKYTTELERCFTYRETFEYQPVESAFCIFLKNGYAQAKFENPNKWVTPAANRVVTEITVVFSKYPYFKDDWITNYYFLLSKRLKSLFALDPSLNSSKIKWNLLVQTNCKTEEDALKLLHGIEIKCTYLSKEELEKRKLKKQESQKIAAPVPHQQKVDSIYDDDEMMDRYWDQEQRKQQEWEKKNKEYQKTFKPKKQKKKRKKRNKGPKCPDFGQKKRWWNW